MANASTDQIAMLQNLLAAVNALKDSVGITASKTTTKTTSSRTKKVKDPNAPKKALNPKIAAQNEERKKIYEEMQNSYFAANPSAEGIDPKEIRKMAKEGKLPPFPTYPQALKEHSRRMSEKDPEHAKKAQAYRERVDAKQAEKKKDKGSNKTSETSSIASGNEAAPEIFTADSPIPPSPPTPAPVPAPAPAPAAEEKKARGRPKKIASSAPAPAPAQAEPQPEITITTATSDPEEFNMKLKMPDNKTYLLNSKNWVLDTENMEWVGIYDPSKKTIDTNAPEPE
jgi:hypothetical protein